MDGNIIASFYTNLLYEIKCRRPRIDGFEPDRAKKLKLTEKKKVKS